MPRTKVETGKDEPNIDFELKFRSSRVKLPTILAELRRLTENLIIDGSELILVEQNINQNMIKGKILITVTSKFQSSE